MTAHLFQAGLLMAIPATPLLLAFTLSIWSGSRLLRLLAQGAALPGLVCALALPAAIKIDLPWLLLGVQLGLDATTHAFLFFTGLLWLTAGVYAASYLAQDRTRNRFALFFLLAMTGNLGLVIAQDILSFYLFFALMSFAAYGLIVHESTTEARRAGRIYIIMLLAGELALFAGLVLAAQHAGSLLFADAAPALADAPARHLIVALLVGGFGIKLGILGLHVWLPLAHPVAPTPASAVLSGAMIKAGLLGLINLLPLGETASLSGWGAGLMIAGFLAVFYAAAIGVAQDNPKTVLAYSSVSQMGLATVAIGLGLVMPHRWPEILAILVFFALNHALAKSALFLGVSVAASWLTSHWQRWLVMAGLAVPALVLAGAPFTGGGLVKELLSGQIEALAEPWGGLLKTLLAWTLLATMLLMARFLYLVWLRAGATDRPTAIGMYLPWSVLIATLLFSPFYFGPAGADQIWTSSSIFSSLASLTLASAATVLGGWLASIAGAQRIPRLPAGDLLVMAERLAALVLAFYRRLSTMFRHLYRRILLLQRIKHRWPRRILAPYTTVEPAWTPASLFFLLLLVIFGLVSAT